MKQNLLVMFLNRLLFITGYRLEKVNALTDAELLERQESFLNIFSAYEKYKEFKSTNNKEVA